jgi:hypothetical protein
MYTPQDALNLIIALGILVGVIQCFFGYRIFKFVLGMTGFLLGAALAGVVGYNISQQVITGVFAGILGGVIGALLMFALYFVGVFLFGAFLGGVLGATLYGMAGSNPEPVALIILAVVFGLIALVFQKFMIIVSTAFNGAWNVVTGIAYFTAGSAEPSNLERLFRSRGAALYMMTLCWVLLGITGVIIQYKSAPKEIRKT